MKKFMTVLLVIAVMFTFSFGSAFAADPIKYYTADEAAEALDAVKTTEMLYVNAAKVKYLDRFAYDSTTGFATKFDGSAIGAWAKYQEAAVVAGAEKTVDQAEDAMEDVIRGILDTYPTAGMTASELDTAKASVRTAAAAYYSTTDAFRTKVGANTATMDKVQAPLTKAYYESLVAKYYNPDNYPAAGAYKVNPTDKALTAKEVVAYVAAEAAKKFAEVEADTTKTNADKITAYGTAYSEVQTLFGNFKDNGNGVTTITSKEETDAAEKIAVDNAIAGLKAYATGTFYNNAKRPVVAAGSKEVKDLSAWFTNFVYGTADYKDEPLYVKKPTAKNATFCGVEVKDVTQVTRAEVVAINAALYEAILNSVDAAEVYAGVKGAAAVSGLYDTEAQYIKTLVMSAILADVYADVVELGDDLKGMYDAGVKTYDDAKVDAAVKAAEDFVYGDLAGTFADAEDYIVEAVADIEDDTTINTYPKALAELELEGNCPNELFVEAIKDAKDKFIPTIITYGANKTADADKVYCRNYYAESLKGYGASAKTYGEKYDDIKTKTLAKLDLAQSYAEIDEIMADAAAKLAKLMVAEGSSKVTTARTTYTTALETYKNQVAGIKGTDYTKGYADALTAGKKLIGNAITVDAVKAAFAEAQAKLDGVVTDEAIEDAEDAANALIKAIPAYSKLTVADKAAVEAAREAVDALPYGENVSTTRLENAEEKIFELEADVLEEEVKAVEKAIAALGTSLLNDRDAAAAVAMKAEVQALDAKVKAHNDAVEAYELDYVELSADCDVAKTAIDTFLAPVNAGSAVYGAELYIAKNAINALEVSGKTVDAEAVKDAQAKYENLNDRQQYILICQGVKETLNLAQEALVDDVEALKITASSVVKKGSITVKWSVDGNEEAADAYEIWRSTKKNSGFKKMFTTEKMSYKNTKNLKKGTRYYFKVRAIATIDGEKVKSDWSNKAYRVAK